MAHDESEELCRNGALELQWAASGNGTPKVILTAIGAYQLVEVLKASKRLEKHSIAHRVIYMLEPGRFRMPRSDAERSHLAPAELMQRLYPEATPARVFVCHTRPEPMLGILRPIDTGLGRTVTLGFRNRGGTLDVNGMLFVNQLTWAHCLVAVASVLAMPRETLLTPFEIDALDHNRSPQGVLFPLP